MRILKTLMIIALYELSKYVTEQILIKLTANDAVDKVPMDYEISKSITQSQAKRMKMNAYNTGGF